MLSFNQIKLDTAKVDEIFHKNKENIFIPLRFLQEIVDDMNY